MKEGQRENKREDVDLFVIMHGGISAPEMIGSTRAKTLRADMMLTTHGMGYKKKTNFIELLETLPGISSLKSVLTALSLTTPSAFLCASISMPIGSREINANARSAVYVEVCSLAVTMCVNTT